MEGFAHEDLEGCKSNVCKSNVMEVKLWIGWHRCRPYAAVKEKRSERGAPKKREEAKWAEHQGKDQEEESEDEEDDQHFVVAPQTVTVASDVATIADINHTHTKKSYDKYLATRAAGYH